MRIGQVAARTGVSVRALRYYEQQGLLAPGRTGAGQRVFGPEHLRAVGTIRELLAAGFCSSVIADLLPLLARPDVPVAELGAAFDAARARLAGERDAIDRQLRALAHLRERSGVAPDVHVRGEGGGHDHTSTAAAAPPDHRDRQLRRVDQVLP